MVEDYQEITDSEEVGKLAKGLGDVRGFRHRIIEILRGQPDQTMLVADLVREISTDPKFYLSRDTLNFHMDKMRQSGILVVEDVTLEKETQEGRLKIQAVVKLKKDVRIFVKDL
jgi:hypothetical protein